MGMLAWYYAVFAVPVGIIVTIIGLIWMFLTARRERAGVPWIAMIATFIVGLPFPIVGTLVAAIIWRSQVDDRINEREKRRRDYEASRIKPRRSLSSTPTQQPVASVPFSPVAPSGVSQARVTSHLATSDGVDLNDRAEQARIVDGIIDTILELYPDHPQSQRIRAGRNGHHTS